MEESSVAVNPVRLIKTVMLLMPFAGKCINLSPLYYIKGREIYALRPEELESNSYKQFLAT